MQRSGAAAVADPSDRIQKLADYLKANLETSEVKDLFAKASDYTPEQAYARLRQGATNAGYAGIARDSDRSSC
jgi:hypothetical protein